MYIAQFKGNNTRCDELSVRSRRKEDKGGRMLGAPICWPSRRNQLRTPPRFAVLSNFAARHERYAPQHFKQEQRKHRPLPPDPKKRRHMALGNATSTRSISSSSRLQTEEKQNAHLCLRRRAEQDEPHEQREHRRSESHGGGFEETLKGRERRKDKEDEESGGNAANL